MRPADGYRETAAGAVLTALQAIMERHGYLPEDELRRAAAELGVPLSQVYAAATFYSGFSLVPRGRQCVSVCLGTACYVRGGQRIVEALAAALTVEPGETTPDGAFTLQVVHCAGSCSMSPVMQVDGRRYGRLKPDLALRVLELAHAAASKEPAP